MLQLVEYHQAVKDLRDSSREQTACHAFTDFFVLKLVLLDLEP